MKHIGIISALPAETRLIFNQKIPLSRPVRINHNISLYICGMGQVNASRAADHLLESGVHGLISWGMAGALSEELKSGDLAVPEKIMTESGKSYPADKIWHKHINKLLEEFSIKAHLGIQLSTNEVLTTPGEKAKKRKTTGAIAVDMESSAIAESAMIKSIPFITIRAIIDESNMIIPQSISKNINEYGKVSLGGFLKSVLASPKDLGPVMDLYRANQKASKSLSILGKHINKILL